jgi:hypothetical protein
VTRRLRTILLATALLLGLLPSAAPAANPVSTEGNGSDNVRHVKNLQFVERTDLRVSTRSAVDTDFFTWTVPAGWQAPADLDPALAPAPGEQRDFAFVGTYINGLQVVDVTDPENPAVVAVYECAISQSDVDLFHREDLGRTFIAYSSEQSPGQTVATSRCHRDNAAFGAGPNAYGTFIVEVTDPYRPESASFVRLPKASHQTTVHPSGRWLYSSPGKRTIPPAVAAARVGQVDVVDLTDPTKPGTPVHIPFLTGFDSHDLSFNASGTRAYVAALTHSVILDTTDPAAPTVLGSIVDPALDVHHDAQAIRLTDPVLGARDFMIIGDEFNGASGNDLCPGGGLHIYDITGPLERRPVKVGVYFVPEIRLTRTPPGRPARCTSHVLQVHPAEQLMTVAWFNGGMRVLDLSGLVRAVVDRTGVSVGAGIRQVAFHQFVDSDVWAAKTNRIAEDGSFYLFSIDTFRHFDVYRVSGTKGATGPAGRWLHPDAALAEAETRRLALGVPRRGTIDGPWCTFEPEA